MDPLDKLSCTIACSIRKRDGIKFFDRMKIEGFDSVNQFLRFVVILYLNQNDFSAIIPIEVKKGVKASY